MKTADRLVLLFVLFGSLAVCSQAQLIPHTAPPLLPTAPSVMPQIVARGPHHNVFENTRLLTNQITGALLPRVSRYTQLGNGLNYLNDGQYQESHEQFAIAIDGSAVATQTLHQVILSPNLNTAGSFDLLAPDGKRLRGHVLAIGFYDATSGQVALFATLTNSIGQLQLPGKDTVIYPDAFSGLSASVAYVNRKSGLSQWVILHQPPLSPESYGMNPDTTRLEVFTEFIEAPVPHVTGHILESETDPVRRQAMVSPDWIDDFLDFGELKFTHGRAFVTAQDLLVSSSLPPGRGVRVGKSLVQANGRTVLVESVKWTDAQSLFASLNLQTNMFAATPTKSSAAATFSHSTLADHLPVVPAHVAKQSSDVIQLASASPSKPGVVLDWESMTGGSDVTLRSGTTYYINRGATLFGTTTIQDAVVKYAKGASLWLYAVPNPVYGQPPNPVAICQTGPYSNAVFTAAVDNSVGDVVATGDLTENYASTALWLFADDTQLSHIRIAFADEAIRYYEDFDDHMVCHAQIVHCTTGIVGEGGGLLDPQDVTLRNVLMMDVTTGFSAEGDFRGDCQHLTVDGCATLFTRKLFFGNAFVTLINSILANVGDLSGVNGNYNGFAGGSAPFGNTQFQETGSVLVRHSIRCA